MRQSVELLRMVVHACWFKQQCALCGWANASVVVACLMSRELGFYAVHVTKGPDFLNVGSSTAPQQITSQETRVD